LTFVVVMCFLLNLLKRALQDELDEFFKVLTGAEFAVRLVSKSAFCQARQKLKYEAFIELNQTQVGYFYDHLVPTRWHAFRLMAVDGSMGDLPNTAAVCAHFGVWHPAVGGTCPKARLSQMFDVLNRVTLDALIAPKSVDEREAAARHFAHLKRGDLVLLDRGYPAFWLFALILSKNAQFCVRFNSEGWKVVEAFLASGQWEQLVTLEPSADARTQCQAHGLPAAPLTLRLLRIELDGGGVEVLGTSLIDPQGYPYALFKELYHTRWPVEEDYKTMKSRVEVENWSGESVVAIYQDFHAKVFTKNLTAMLTHPLQPVVAQASQEKRYLYRTNMTHALSKMKDTVVLLLHRANPLPLLKRVWRLMLKTIEPVRPGRSYRRQPRVKRRRFIMNYKPIR
jgi:Transposase DDE domain